MFQFPKSIHPSSPREERTPDVAPKWLRMHEEGHVHQMLVEESIGTRFLKPLGNMPLDLITIFGQARKGKSFLMNKLASKTRLFPVHNR
jgi:hypothetical protein